MNADVLLEHNPWWVTGVVDLALSGRMRGAYGLLLKSVNEREITIITGVRRSGKSTLMYQMINSLLASNVSPKQVLFVNLEDPNLAGASLEDIYAAYRTEINPDKKSFVFFDEVHRKDGWESWVRRQYDLKRDCKFVISGSSSYLLRREYSTLLTGRNISFEVFPLSFKEFLEFKEVYFLSDTSRQGLVLDADKYVILSSLKEYMVSGGFPDISFKGEDFKKKLLIQYFDDILYKDIVDRYNLNSQKVRELAIYFMSNITGQFSLRSLRNTLGLSYESITDYISYFQEAFLFNILDNFSYSLKEQKTSPTKIYCVDTGLRNAVSFKFSKDEGKLAENVVFVALKHVEREIYYWKGSGGEVDFIIKHADNTLSAINVTYGEEIASREIKGLLDFKKLYHKRVSELIIITKDIDKTEGGIIYIPLWKWLIRE